MGKTRIGINGFGRIGRQVLKTIWQRHRDTLEVVAINDLFDTATNAHLLRHDTSYGKFSATVECEEDVIRVGGEWEIKSFAQRDPKLIPWKSCGVDIVIESTGIFRTGPTAGAHLESGAKKVIITAPSKDEDLTVVIGVNEGQYDPAVHHVVSNASCTTNCLAPAVKVMHGKFGVAKGVLTTVHAYTNDQRILDLPHKDLRRARAAACNMIPTSTGAAKAVAKVIPEMKGRFDGYSVRVPVPAVSLVDFVAVLERDITTEELKAAFKEAANGELQGILGYSEDPLVSSDFIADPHSGVVEADFTTVQAGNLAKVFLWYDNEWGYSCRVADLAHLMAQKGF